MNKTLISSLVIALFTALFTVAQSQNILLKDISTRFELLESDQYHISFENKLGAIDAMTIITREGNYSEILVPGYGSTTDEGNPKLPVLKHLIEVPYGAQFDVSLRNITTETLKLSAFNIQSPIMPVQPPVSKSVENPDDLPFIFNEKTYSTNEFFGFDLVKVEDEGIVRGSRLARIDVSPVKYNPVTGELQIVTSFSCEIIFRGGDIFQTEVEKARVFSPFFEANFQQIINHPEPQNRELITGAPATYIIVSDPMFQTALQPFIQWKTKKGFKVVEAYTNNPSVGNTTTSIKTYLKNFYQNPPLGYLPQSFILLVGDVAQIPAFSGTAGSHITDLYYAEYTNDKIPDTYYGRFSANNLTQLQPQIDKTLQYEKYLMPDPSFLDRVVMVAGADASHQLTWGNGQINYGTTYYFNAAHGLLSHTYLQPEPSGANYSGQIRQNVSNGVGYANYTAHCSSSGWADPSFSTSHISALSNANKYPLMVGNCCLSATFGGTCFAEEIMRAANKGALGYIGGSNNTYWDEDYYWGVGYKTVVTNPVYNSTKLGAYDRTFHDQAGITLQNWYVTQGQMVSAGNLAVQQSNSSMKNYYWEIYHLMGDPSVMIYFSQPPDISVSYPPEMMIGTATFTVNTDPYALVAISRNNVLHGATVANSSGVASITLQPFLETGIADVVVTKQNGKPFLGTVTIISETAPELTLESYQIDDQNGNNNQVADYMEDIFLDVTLNNSGSANATNVLGTLSSQDQYVQIIKSQQIWAEIPTGQSIAIEGAFEVQISDQVPDQHTVTFDLILTDGIYSWDATIGFTVSAPDIQLGDFFIDDSSSGNGNGQPDAGETISLIFPVKNTGHSAVPEVFTLIIYSGNWLEIINQEYFTQALEPSQTENAVFEMIINPEIPNGTNLNVEAEAGFGAYMASKMATFAVGGVTEDFETGNFLKYQWEFLGNQGWVITTTNPLEGSYCAKSGLIGNNETSVFFITIDVLANGVVSFWAKVSSEENHDFLKFYIDEGEYLSLSGNQDWVFSSIPVTPGIHHLVWEYQKDNGGSATGDAAWIDLITFPPADIPMLPVSGFTASSTNIPTFEPVQFTDLSTGQPTQFLWYFEEGTPEFSPQQNPEVFWTVPGEYDVMLSVTNEYGTSTEYLTDYIVVEGTQPESQFIYIPQGWSGISFYLIPENPDLLEIFSPIMDDLVILQQMNGVFSPMFGVNSIGEWDSNSGYKIKLENPAYLEISGTPIPDNQVEMQTGWNLMPVLSECPVSVEYIFQNVSGEIVVVKEIAGMGTYWPSMNINTLGTLMPGNAYFILVDSPFTITFPGCD